MAEWVYDLTEDEPAPLVEGVVFARWGLGVRIPIQFQVDTGASMTVILMAVLQSLGVLAVRAASIRYADNRLDVLPIYEVDIEIVGVEILSVEVAGGKLERALLGRDVLNYFVLTLDGPGRLTRLEYRG